MICAITEVEFSFLFLNSLTICSIHLYDIVVKRDLVIHVLDEACL